MLPNVFIAPVTVPTALPPTSWQIAHDGLRHMSASPAAAANNTAAANAFGTSAAAIRHKPLAGSATTPIDRPTFSPYPFASRSVSPLVAARSAVRSSLPSSSISATNTAFLSTK